MNAPAVQPVDPLFLDNHLLALNKPAGLLTQDSGSGRDNLEDRARRWLARARGREGPVFLHAIHRLDREVSGIVLFARTGKALSRLNAALRERLVQKTYLALAEEPAGDPPTLLEDWLLHADRRAEIVRPGAPGARAAALECVLLRRQDGLALLEVTPRTGRYHQIRAQLAHAGMPIVGDARYGSRRPFRAGAIALHHGRLRLLHPVRKEPLLFEVDPPPEFPFFARGMPPARYAQEP